LEYPGIQGEDNIKRDLQELEFGGRDWIDLAKDRNSWRALVNTLMNLGGSIKFEKFIDELRTG
jgi:hypothetical protein